MSNEHLEFTVEGMRLAGTIMRPDDQPARAGLLRIGGGANQPHRPNQWQQWLARQNIASFGFDFRGVGESDCKLEETTLNTRLEDARAAWETFAQHTGATIDEIYLLGTSMGAPLAIRVAAEYQAAGLILASPAAYTPEAFDKPFGSEFSAVIQEPGSWEQSQEFEMLETYNGRWLLTCAGRDEVIPTPILEHYTDITSRHDQTLLKLDTCHAFLRETSPELEARSRFWQEVISFLHPTNH